MWEASIWGVIPNTPTVFHSHLKRIDGVVGVVGGPRVGAITGGLFRGNGPALCVVGWNPSAMALQSSRVHHKCTTCPRSIFIPSPDESRSSRSYLCLICCCLYALFLENALNMFMFWILAHPCNVCLCVLYVLGSSLLRWSSNFGCEQRQQMTLH